MGRFLDGFLVLIAKATRVLRATAKKTTTTLFCFIVLQRFSSLIKAELFLDTSHRSVLSAFRLGKASVLDVNFAEIRDLISLFVIY